MRVHDWLAGHGSLSGETRNYVSAITGRSADDWAASMRRHDSQDLAATKRTSCGELLALWKAEPALFADVLERRAREGTELP